MGKHMALEMEWPDVRLSTSYKCTLVRTLQSNVENCHISALYYVCLPPCTIQFFSDHKFTTALVNPSPLLTFTDSGLTHIHMHVFLEYNNISQRSRLKLSLIMPQGKTPKRKQFIWRFTVDKHGWPHSHPQKVLIIAHWIKVTLVRSRLGAVMRALTFQQWASGLVSQPYMSWVYLLSFLVKEDFSPGTTVYPLTKGQHLFHLFCSLTNNCSH